MRSGVSTGLSFLLCAVLALVVANAAIPTREMPNYGTWTGIRPLEEKLDKLDAFAREGPVDALIFGSSIADFGFSARLFSEIMSAAQGRPYRAFNFSTGATEIVTMPKLYRMARTSAVPRTMVIIPSYSPIRSNTIPPRSPDYIMERAPIHRALVYPWLLPVDRRVWQAPLIRHAAALRDQIIHGSFVSLPKQGSDLYSMNRSGDIEAYLLNASSDDLSTIRRNIEARVRAPESFIQPGDTLQANVKRYFNDIDIDAMAQLKSLSQTDGFRIVVLAHGQAAEFHRQPVQSPSVRRERREYFEVLAEGLGAQLVYDIDTFTAPDFAVSDSIHLNYHGALMYTRRVTQALLGQPIPQAEIDAWQQRTFPHLPAAPIQDPSLSTFTAIIEGPPAEDRRTLRLTVLINHAIPPLPNAPLSLALRLPNNEDVIVPVRRPSTHVFEADVPAAPVGSDQYFLARLVMEAGGRNVTFNQPLASYHWVHGATAASR